MVFLLGVEARGADGTLLLVMGMGLQRQAQQVSEDVLG